MNDMVIGGLAWLAGLLLGVIFFVGLWWTVRKCVTSARPALWILGSLLLRMSITLTGFYFVADGQWQRLLLCFLGFIMARFAVTFLLPSPTQALSTPEANHAP